MANRRPLAWAVLFGVCSVFALVIGMRLLALPSSAPSPEIREHMTQFASIDRDTCWVGGCYGWREAVLSPNGEYFYKNHVRHYGWISVAVLRSDYSEVLYYNNGDDMGSMHAGGCFGEGWTSDGDLELGCYWGGLDYKRTGTLNPETGEEVWGELEQIVRTSQP